MIYWPIYVAGKNCPDARFSIQVTVHNNITNPEEGTGLHWHGLLQRATPWYDGVPGVQVSVLQAAVGLLIE
jgi:FtsP/CotA-like multicopper oxidase with cupredoxin domain